MKITEIVLVTENWKGTEKNCLMTAEDYLKYLDLDKFDSRKDVAEAMLELGKTFGDVVKVDIWEDKEERVVIVPEDVQILLNSNKKALDFYEKLSYTHRKEYIRWIEDAKKEETRERRKVKMIDLLLAKKKGI